tara:strand:+ start:982 stop:1389 length:408 start_codon:yes stop_codon:yes gene_type:complete
MKELTDVYCLNKLHTNLVFNFLSELQSVIDKSVAHDKRCEQFDLVVEQAIIVHNGIGVFSIEGDISNDEWYLSLPNNLYWATIGFFSSLDSDMESPLLDIYKNEALIVIQNYIVKLKNSLIIQSITDGENIKNLN